MRKEEIYKQSSMPIAGPSYPKGPYRFIEREHFNIIYESDPEAIREALPEPLEPDGSNQVIYEFISMPDSSGFGDYKESGVVIPCLFKGEQVNFIAQMYLDCEPPIAAGREIWGFPKKHANPDLGIVHDTLTGTLKYAEQLVAVGTMGYKHENLVCKNGDNKHCNINDNIQEIIKKVAKTQINLKLIPNVDGTLAIAQLVGYNMCDVTVKGAWKGPARLYTIPHVNAPVADLPVKKVIEGMHFIVNATLPYGYVLYDYLKERK